MDVGCHFGSSREQGRVELESSGFAESIRGDLCGLTRMMRMKLQPVSKTRKGSSVSLQLLLASTGVRISQAGRHVILHLPGEDPSAPRADSSD